MGRIARLAGLAARIAYAAVAGYVTLSAVDSVARIASSFSPEASASLARAGPFIAFLAASSTRMAAIPLLSVIVLAALEPGPPVAIEALGLVVLHTMSQLYSAGRSGGELVSARRLVLGILVTLATLAGPGLLFAPVPIYFEKLLEALGSLAEKATGELPTVERLLAGTILFRVLAGGLILGLAYKAIYNFVDLITSWRLPSAYARAEAEAAAESERRVLEHFRGPQYPALESTSSWILAFLFAPMVYDTLNAGFSKLPLDIDPIYRALASTLIGLLIGWAVLRIITISIVRSVSLEALLSPKPATPLLVGLIVASGILAAYMVAGGRILDVLRAAVTGVPQGDDPLANAVNPTPGEDYYSSLARLVDLLVRLFWGG